MNALILAGGENSRIQIQKGLLKFNGKRAIETRVELLKKYFNKVYISTNSPEVYYYAGSVMIGDIMDVRGPMTGIFSALVDTRHSELFVTACDMPFMEDGLLRLMIDRYEGQDALVPVYQGRPQPLPGIYKGSLTGIMENKIRYGNRSMMDLLHCIDTCFLREEDVAGVDPEGRSFVNINTMQDYERAIRMSISNRGTGSSIAFTTADN